MHYSNNYIYKYIIFIIIFKITDRILKIETFNEAREEIKFLYAICNRVIEVFDKNYVYGL